MKRWIKIGMCALTLGVLLSANVLATDISISLDKQGTKASVALQDVGTDRYAAEVTFSVSNTEAVQFVGKADEYAVTIDSVAGTVTLYTASRSPLTVTNGKLELGTLTIQKGTDIKGPGEAIVLDKALNRTTYTDVALNVTQQATDDSNSGNEDSSNSNSSNNSSSSSDSDSSTDRTPTVSTEGNGGKVRATSDGRVVITPDEGYRIARILVNGKEVAITTRLTGLKASDKVVVIFEKIEAEENVSEQLPFTDVQSTDWYADAVQFAVSKGLFHGVSETEFAPNVEMSRAMLVTVLYRMSGEQAQTNGAFEDVPADAWYAQAVAWAKDNNIVSGMSDTIFDPDRAVTREQMAAILYRYAQREALEDSFDATALQTFADTSSISDYATSAMGWAVHHGMISGMGEQMLAPAGSATRAQVASILQRFIQNMT